MQLINDPSVVLALPFAIVTGAPGIAFVPSIPGATSDSDSTLRSETVIGGDEAPVALTSGS